jgi:hypothetical protein
MTTRFSCDRCCGLNVPAHGGAASTRSAIRWVGSGPVRRLSRWQMSSTKIGGAGLPGSIATVDPAYPVSGPAGICTHRKAGHITLRLRRCRCGGSGHAGPCCGRSCRGAAAADRFRSRCRSSRPCLPVCGRPPEPHWVILIGHAATRGRRIGAGCSFRGRFCRSNRVGF